MTEVYYAAYYYYYYALHYSQKLSQTIIPSQGCMAVSIDTCPALARFVGQFLVAYRVPTTSLSLPALLSDCFVNPSLLRIRYINNIVLLVRNSRSSITECQWCHYVSVSSSANFYEVDSNSSHFVDCQNGRQRCWRLGAHWHSGFYLASVLNVVNLFQAWAKHISFS